MHNLKKKLWENLDKIDKKMVAGSELSTTDAAEATMYLTMLKDLACIEKYEDEGMYEDEQSHGSDMMRGRRGRVSRDSRGRYSDRMDGRYMPDQRRYDDGMYEEENYPERKSYPRMGENSSYRSNSYK